MPDPEVMVLFIRGEGQDGGRETWLPKGCSGWDVASRIISRASPCTAQATLTMRATKTRPAGRVTFWVTTGEANRRRFDLRAAYVEHFMAPYARADL